MPYRRTPSQLGSRLHLGPDVATLTVIIVKQGEQDIPHLVGNSFPKRLGPKRATNVRRFVNLAKEDDVYTYVVRREVTNRMGDAKSHYKAYISFIWI